MESEDPLIVIPATQIDDDRVKWAVENIPKFCVLPWINLHTTPTGDMKLCCSIQYNSFITDSDDEVFNMGRDDIRKIWNSGFMRYTREQHRTGNGISSCLECYRMEEVNGHSPRVGQNEEWIRRQEHDQETKDALETSTSNLIEDLPHLPISLELRLGNQCNLQCISCWGMSSSLIQDERKNLISSDLMDGDPITRKYKEQWKKEVAEVDNSDLRQWFDTDVFYNNIRLIAPTLKRLYTTGGEPTLIKANYKMMQMMLDVGNRDCAIEFTSNMVTWNKEFYNRLDQFHNAEIQMSLDGMGEIGEYLRYPSNMDKIRENVFRAVEMASDKPGWKIKCYTVLQALNYKHLIPIWELLREVSDKYNKQIDWWPITLYSPGMLSVSSVSKEQRSDYVEETFKAQVEAFNKIPSKFKVSDHTVNACLDSILNPQYNEELNKKLNAYIGIMDKSRSLNGLELFSKELNNGQ